MPEWVLQILLVGALYGGIRADLKHAILTAESAHKRIDALILKKG